MFTMMLVPASLEKRLRNFTRCYLLMLMLLLLDCNLNERRTGGRCSCCSSRNKKKYLFLLVVSFIIFGIFSKHSKCKQTYVQRATTHSVEVKEQ